MGFLALAACQGSDNLTGRNAELGLAALKAATEHGFPAERFEAQRIEALLNGSREQRAQGERRLRAALVDYARAQHGLTIPSSVFPPDWGLKPAPYDAEAELASALKAGRFKAWLEAQPTPLPAYAQLQKAYLAYLKIHAQGGWPTVPPMSLALGAQSPQIAALRRRLAFEDAALAPADGPVDTALIQALQRFQAAHGLPTSGRLDDATLAELNAPALSRAAQIRASLERLRWLPRDEPTTRIDVNTAAAVTDYYVDGRLAMHMLSASGRPGGDETPMLKSEIDAIVLNPPWNVPDEIAAEEILPKGEAYLQRMGFAMKDGRLVQAPGPEAALGQVKFDFANPYAVYLHDTPAKAAFSRSQRAVSHGCVRLAQAVPLAKALLANEPGWSAARIDEALAAGETIRVELRRKTPVRLVYLTAFPENGRIAFRPDVYGWDAELLRMLDHPPKAKSGKET